MKHLPTYILIATAFSIVACHTDVSEVNNDPEGTIYYTETDELFANPERGLYKQIYYTSKDLSEVLNSSAVKNSRTGKECITLYLHSYYLTDYIESDIPQAFLDRLQQNMDALRAGGGKVILRFSYKSSEKEKPYDASSEWVSRHIDQLTPYFQKNADVILCLQAGFIGVWGEWYYTTGFPSNPVKTEDWEPRWTMLDHLLETLPADRQIALRTPAYKRQYLKDRGLTDEPISVTEAFQQTAKARLAGHNDCFVSSSNDVGTYRGESDRNFWAEDTRYTFMGGETCNCVETYSNGVRAISEMEKYHWSYLCCSYHPDVLNSWAKDGSYKIIQRRLGYRFVLDKAYPTQIPKAGEKFAVVLTLRNEGFSAPINPRNVELVFVSVNNPAQKYVYLQNNIDPRFWSAEDTTITTLHAVLDKGMMGEYKVYLNLPDPCATLHDNPAYSIRLANKEMWDETMGYNYLLTISL